MHKVDYYNSNIYKSVKKNLIFSVIWSWTCHIEGDTGSIHTGELGTGNGCVSTARWWHNYIWADDVDIKIHVKMSTRKHSPHFKLLFFCQCCSSYCVLKGPTTHELIFTAWTVQHTIAHLRHVHTGAVVTWEAFWTRRYLNRTWWTHRTDVDNSLICLIFGFFFPLAF